MFLMQYLPKLNHERHSYLPVINVKTDDNDHI